MSNDEYQVLRYRLNHGLATHQKETNILANAESIWDQINKNNVCKKSRNHVQRAKISLREWHLVLSTYRINKFSKIKRNLILLNSKDYYNGVEKLFQDKQKFKQILEDPTLSRLTSLQRYLKKLNNPVDT